MRALLLLLLSGCRSGDNPHREAARAVLEQHCGKCHRSDSPDANPRALQIFTLNDVDFAAHMTDQELRDMLGRFTGEITSDEVSADELRIMRTFVDAERQRR